MEQASNVKQRSNRKKMVMRDATNALDFDCPITVNYVTDCKPLHASK